MSELPANAKNTTPHMSVYTTLIDPVALEKHVQFVKILDCRARLGDPEFGRSAYAAGHLPGSVFLSLDDDLAAPAGDGGRHPLPQPDRLASKLGELGASDADQVVVYDDAGGAFAARAWWCLRWLGHEAVAVLDGGINAWTGSLETALVAPVSAVFSVRPSLTRAIDGDQLLAGLDDHSLVDARSDARFEGLEEPIDPVAGHIPGAVCRPFQDNLDDRGRFLPAAVLGARFPADGSVVCYCGSGVTAAHNILAMCIAGLEEPMLYPGSWSEWIRDVPGRAPRPRASGPGNEGR